MYSAIYWLTRLDGILILLGFAVGVCAMIVIMTSLASISLDSYDDDDTAFIKWRKPAFFVGICAIACVFIPTKEDAILIYAGGKAYDYIQSDTSLQKIPYKTTEYLKVVLEKEINEIKNK